MSYINTDIEMRPGDIIGDVKTIVTRSVPVPDNATADTYKRGTTV